MFRITVSTHEQTTTIRVEGCLKAICVPDLREAWRSAGNAVRLDLSDLTSADAEGVHVLRSLRSQGAEIHGASPYICQLLEKETH
jgi:anti-anti-sigma regulatory factor